MCLYFKYFRGLFFLLSISLRKKKTRINPQKKEKTISLWDWRNNSAIKSLYALSLDSCLVPSTLVSRDSKPPLNSFSREPYTLLWPLRTLTLPCTYPCMDIYIKILNRREKKIITTLTLFNVNFKTLRFLRLRKPSKRLPLWILYATQKDQIFISQESPENTSIWKSTMVKYL